VKSIYFKQLMFKKIIKQAKTLKIGLNYFQNRLKYALIEIQRMPKILKLTQEANYIICG